VVAVAAAGNGPAGEGQIGAHLEAARSFAHMVGNTFPLSGNLLPMRSGRRFYAALGPVA
jgi:hypothetical protein